METNRIVTAGSSALLVYLCLGTAPAWADEANLSDKIHDLKERINLLEDKQAIQSESWADRISFGGVVEVEANFTEAADGDESDLALATVELGVDARVSDHDNAHMLILFEEGEPDDTFEIDEAIITLGNPEQSPFYLAAGRMYLPFGNFESNMVSAPLTLEIGETRETAVQAGFESGELYGSVFLFNGDISDGGDDRIDQFGANIGFARDAGEASLGFDIGLSYMNSLADSDALQEGVTDPGNLTHKVAGVSLHAIVRNGPFTLIGEYVTASDSFDVADLSFDGRGAKPESWNLEAG